MLKGISILKENLTDLKFIFSPNPVIPPAALNSYDKITLISVFCPWV